MRLTCLPAKCLALLLFFFLSLFFYSAPISAQNASRIIRGKITDETGKGLQGVNVQLKGSTAGSTTKSDGSFEITVPSAKGALLFSYVGYEEQQVLLSDNLADISLAMRPALNAMSDVVVVGYGTQKKSNITGSVSSFDARKLDERPIQRLDQALVGQLAGVTVKQTSGGLGKGYSIQIRGVGSISAGSEPLYVIDGFPLATAKTNTSGGYSTGNPLDNINPNDIESIQVLKDAAAAAIYGSRAANGVVMITTKKGQSGKAKISVNSYVGYMERSRKLDMLSAEEWIDRSREIIDGFWVNQAAVPAGTVKTASQTNEQRRVLLGLPVGGVNPTYMYDDRWYQPGHPGLRYIDWQDEAFRKGMGQNHQVSLSGGNDFVRYYVSGNYGKQEGMVINTDYTYYSARANVEANVNKKLKIGLNINPTYSVNNDPAVEGKDNVLHQLISFAPVQLDSMGLYPNVGNYGQYIWSTSANGSIGKLKNILGVTKRFRTITSIYGDYEFIKGLNFRTTVNLDNTDNNSKTYVPYIVASTLSVRLVAPPIGGTGLTSGTYNSFRKQTLVNENTLSYSKVFRSVHDVSVLLGQSFNQDKIETISMNSSGGFRDNGITTLNDAVAVTGNTQEARNVLISYFGRLQYGYDNKYLLSASIRRDGSSRFGANTRWGVFPSASVGWVISKEKFMQDIAAINYLKIRGSWGKAGNYNIGDYSTISTLGTFNYTLNNLGVTGQAPNSITNPDLAWEKSETYDVGFDISFLRNRFSASFDYYTRLSTDLLLNLPVLGVTGFNTYLNNAGSARNKGWEIELTSRNVTGKFEWTTSANISHNTNKLVSLPNGQTQILIPSSLDINHSLLRIGQPLYSIFVVKQIGILSADDIAKGAARLTGETEGDPKYFDATGDGKIDANDRVIVGHPTPDYTWGVTNTFRYQGFDLNVQVQGQNGGSVYSLLGRALNRTGQGQPDNALGTYRNRWRSASDPGDGLVGKVYQNFGRIKNTDWLYSSNYFRVRDITLGYNLGKLINSKHIQTARVYLTLENFFGHDKYLGGFNPEATNTDVSGSGAFPEASDYGGLPIPKSLVFGVTLTF